MSVNSPQTRSLPGKLTGLRIQSLLSTEAKPEFRQDEPALEVKMTRKGGEVLSYRFSKPADPSYYALKRSDRDHYFKVAEYSVTPVGTVKLKERHGPAAQNVGLPWPISLSSRPRRLVIDAKRRPTFPLCDCRVC
ncbi:MAG: hypothetical protein V3T38_07690 [Gammaproteobacteria bacterium]